MHESKNTGIPFGKPDRVSVFPCCRGRKGEKAIVRTVAAIAFTGLSLIASATAEAREIRVGTPAEITAAMAAAQPGDTLTMTSGVWSNASVVFAGNGTQNAPIMLRAEAPGAVSMEGSSTLRIGGTYLVVDGLSFRNGYSPSGGVIEFRYNGLESRYCRLTNTSIVDYNPANAATDYKWISLYGSYNRVDHCSLKGKTHVGTTLVVWLSATPNYHRIDHNHFGLRPPLGVNGGETIRVGTSDWSMYDSYTVVEQNLFEECNGEAEIISSKSCGNIYRNNTFRRCQGALTLRHGNRCLVEGNFFFGEGVSNTGGIRVIGEDHRVQNNYLTGLKGTGYRATIAVMNGKPNSLLNEYYQVKRASIVFNTLVGNSSSIDVGVGKSTDLTLPPEDCVIANMVVTSTSGPLVRFTDTPLNLRWEGNVFYGASLGITQPGGIVIADPQLAAADPYGLRRPGALSPVLDAAVGTYDTVTQDMDGQDRSGLKDIGADEVSALPVLHVPLTAADVGPVSPVTAVGPEHSSLNPGDGRAIPEDDILYPPYPNPFNPETTLRFAAAGSGHAALDVYSVSGEHVAALFRGAVAGGQVATVVFDASGLASGVYVLVLTRGTSRAVQRMVLTR